MVGSRDCCALSPVVCDPGGGFDVAKTTIATASQGIWWIAFAVENNDPCAVWNERLFPEIAGPCRYAIVFKAGAPGFGPISQEALLVHVVRQVGLLVAKALADAVKVLAEIVQHIGVCTQFEPVYRGVAGDAPRIPEAVTVTALRYGSAIFGISG